MEDFRRFLCGHIMEKVLQNSVIASTGKNHWNNLPLRVQETPRQWILGGGTSSRVQGLLLVGSDIIWDASNQTQVRNVQGKCPTCYVIAPALIVSFFTEKKNTNLLTFIFFFFSSSLYTILFFSLTFPYSLPLSFLSSPLFSLFSSIS